MKNTTYWRCVDWTKGCRVWLPTHSVGNQEMTNKANDKIIHEHNNNGGQGSKPVSMTSTAKAYNMHPSVALNDLLIKNE